MIDPLPLADWTWLAGALALAGALVGYALLGLRPSGTPGMVQLGERIRWGALRVLGRGSIALAVFAAGFGGLLVVVFPQERTGAGLAYLGGVVCAGLAAWIGTLASTRANVRSAAAAHQSGEAAALRIALWGGAVGGVAASALGLLGLGALYWAIGSTAVAASDRERFARAVAAFALGASTVALVARVGGGIFAKAADLAARRGGRDDPDNPTRLADQVGDNVGDVSGLGSDLLESAVAAVAATVTIAAAAGGPPDVAAAVVLPILAALIGVVVSGAALALAPLFGRASAAATLRAVTALATLGFVAATFWLVRALGLQGMTDAAGRELPAWGPFAALAAGAGAGLLVGLATEYHTAARPVRKVADAAREGAVPALIWGVAAGLESAALPGMLLAGAVLAAIRFSGLYGLGLAAVGMVATLAVTQAVAACGAITDNASAIGTLSGLPRAARTASDTLGAVGNTTAAVGKGIAGVAAALTALAVVAAFAVETGLVGGAATPFDPALLAGVLLGAMLPFLAAAVVLGGVARAVERVLRAVGGGESGDASAEEARCLGLVGRSAVRESVRPAALAVLTPLVVGLVAGPAALASVLLGAALTGGLLAVTVANTGGLWDNAARFIAGGVHGGRGSPAHLAIAVGETLGDPLKDSCAPALSSLIKLMAVIALALAPWLAAR